MPYSDGNRFNRTMVIEIKNNSGIGTGKRFGDDETTTDIDFMPVAGIIFIHCNTLYCSSQFSKLTSKYQ